MMLAESEWTSLDVAKLVISVLTPVAVVGLGVIVSRAASKLEYSQWANQKVVESRLALFEDVAPMLNRLFCFYTFVGKWKELTPEAVIGTKRALDETMHIHRILFSPAVFDSYDAYMDVLFKTYSGADTDAQLRALIRSRHGDRRNMPWWTDDLTAKFTPSGEAPGFDEVRSAYHHLSERLRADLYLPDAVIEDKRTTVTSPPPAPDGTREEEGRDGRRADEALDS